MTWLVTVIPASMPFSAFVTTPCSINSTTASLIRPEWIPRLREWNSEERIPSGIRPTPNWSVLPSTIKLAAWAAIRLEMSSSGGDANSTGGGRAAPRVWVGTAPGPSAPHGKGAHRFFSGVAGGGAAGAGGEKTLGGGGPEPP